VVDLLTLRTGDVPPAVLAQAHDLMWRAFDDFTDDDWDHGIGGWHVIAVEHPGGGASEPSGAGEPVVVAHAAVVERSIEVDGKPYRTGYVENVATEPERNGEGIGTLVIARIGELVREGYEMGALGTGAHHFYERLGWERWQGPSYVRRAGGLDRSEDEDDGIMVLRFGPSSGIDLRAATSCSERPGDDW
jgi:aminoglycoside 2'-N-acetyltransferase I